MRIIVKILLSFVVIIFSLVLGVFFPKSEPFVRLIPATIMITGIIGIWRYKPSKPKESERNLDKN